MTALLPLLGVKELVQSAERPPAPDPGQERVVHRRRGSVTMRSVDEGAKLGRLSGGVVPQSVDENQLGAVTPTSRIKEKLRHSLTLQVALGGDLVSQIEGETRGRATAFDVSRAESTHVLTSPTVDALTPRLSPFAVYMSGKSKRGVDARARFWDIVSEHGWSDGKVDDLRKPFLTYAVKDQSDVAKLSYDGFENLLPELLKIEKGDILQTRVRRYWIYLDIDKKGEVDFEDFFIWYLKYMPTELDRSQAAYGSTTTPSNLLMRRPSAPVEPKTRTQIHDRKFQSNVHDRKLSVNVERSSKKSLTARRTVDF